MPPPAPSAHRPAICLAALGPTGPPCPSLPNVARGPSPSPSVCPAVLPPLAPPCVPPPPRAALPTSLP
eukprot:1533749-Pleurochrysis_carterae.AAC.1